MAIPHVVLFANANCTGGHFHVFEAQSNLAGVFSDVTSSFVILEGNWQFFADATSKAKWVPVRAGLLAQVSTTRSKPTRPSVPAQTTSSHR